MDRLKDSADIFLEIAGEGEDRWRVSVTAPGGSGFAPFVLAAGLRNDLEAFSWPVAGEALGAQRNTRRREAPAPERSRAAEIGQGLFRALLPPPILRCLDLSPEGRRLRLRWDTHDPRLKFLDSLPWELLCNPETGVFLCLDPDYSLLRQLPLGETSRPPARPRQLRVLAFGPSPGELAPLDVRREWDGLFDLARREKGLKVFRPALKAKLDPHTLRRQLAGRRAHVLHFMGHGDLDEYGEGFLFFTDGAGRAQSFTGQALLQTLRGLPDLRLVVLNACHGAENGKLPFSGLAAALLRGGVPAVIAMQSAISDRAACLFSAELYLQLAHGLPIDRAACEARHALHCHDPGGLEWALPVLFAHPGGEVLFDSRSLPALVYDALPIDVDELRDRYLACLIEQTSQVEMPWLSGTGPAPRLALDRLFCQFQPDPTPTAERPRRTADLEREKERLASLLASQAGDSENPELLLWREVRRLVRGEPAIEAGFGGPRVDEDRWSLEQLLRHRCLVVLGEIGSGKTHLVRWIARHAAEAAARGSSRTKTTASRVDCRRTDERKVDLGKVRLPILVDLLRFDTERRKNPGLRLVNYLGFHLGPRFEIPASDPRDGQPIDPAALRSLLQRELDSGEALLLLDGLDAVGDLATRRALAAEIELLAGSPTGGPSILVTTRAAGYDLLPLPGNFDHFRIAPMDSQAGRAFCRLFPEVAETLGEQGLAEVEAALQRRGAPDWTSSPLFLTLLAAILTRERGTLPARLLDLYEPALGILLARGHELAEQPGTLAGPLLRRLMAELAAELQGRPESLGLIEKNWLVRWLGARLTDLDAISIELLVRRDLGPLVFYSESLLGFLHQALQAYLAACWLIGDPSQAETRLRLHASDPLWRQAAAMALGLLADRLDAEALGELFGRLADPQARDGEVDRDLLGLAAIAELPSGFETFVSDFLADLLQRAASWDGPWLATVEAEIARLLRSGAAPAGWLASTLAAAGQNSGLIAAVSRIASALKEVPVQLADRLQAAEPYDAPPWPLTRSLRSLAAADPELLAAKPFSLRRRLRGDPRLRDRVAGHPGWRRLLLALGIGFRSSPLDPLLLSALERGSPPASLTEELARRAADPADPGRTDAGLVLFALAEATRLPGGKASWRHELDLLAARLEPARPHSAIELLHWLFEQAPNGATSPAEHAATLALLWRELMRPQGDPDDDPRYRLAVFLDSCGGILAASPRLLADSWTGAARGAIRPRSAPNAGSLAAVLDALATLPRSFDFVHGFSLAVLRPLLTEHGLLERAREEAENFSQRLSARSDTRRRLAAAPAEALAKVAEPASAPARPLDPTAAESERSCAELVIRRCDAGDPGASHDTALFQLLLAPELLPPAPPAFEPGDLEAAIRHLAAPDDRQRLEAARLLQGDLGPERHCWTATDLGLGNVLRLAESWLDLAQQDPRQALILRWSLQNIEHDSPPLLRELAELCRDGSPRTAAAVAALRHLEEVDPECGEVLAEILRHGPPGARRALVQGLPNGLAADGPFAGALWAAVGEVLPATAADLEEETVDLAEPLELVAAAERALKETSALLPANLEAAASRASELYRALEVRWSSLLETGGDLLRQNLVRIGQRRKVGQAARRIGPAAEALVKKSELLPLLASWLEIRLRQNVCRNSADDHEATFLLELLAAAARRLPQTYFAATAKRPRWRRLLSEAAIHYDWLPARMASVELLGFGQELGVDEVEALFAALLDSPEAQRRALASLDRYRRLESLTILDQLETELASPSAARAYAAGRLLAALGRPGLADKALRLRSDEMLERALRRETSPRPVYFANVGPQPAARAARIVSLGPLAQLLERCRLELKAAAGFPEIPPWPRSAV